MSHRFHFKHLLGVCAIIATGLIAYAPAFAAGFWTDDFTFIEFVARRNAVEYFWEYLNPFTSQLHWYRPMQGAYWWLAFQFFRTEPTGYHIANTVLHIINALLLFGIAKKFTRKTWVGFVAALTFLVLPLTSIDVFWVGVADPLALVFYLTALLTWLRYLESNQRKLIALAWIAYVCALLTKEMSATLIAMMFLADRLLVAQPTTWRNLMRRYAPFAIVLLAYLAIQALVIPRGVYVSQVAYRPSSQVVPNLLQYLQWTAFPWETNALLKQIAPMLVALGLIWVSIVRRQRGIVFLVLAALVAITPVLMFPFALGRYLYMPLAATAVLAGIAFEWVRTRIEHPIWQIGLVPGLFLGFIFWNGTQVFDQAQSYSNFARDTRLQFRPIYQKHPTLESDTWFYFIEPPYPTPTISAMMYLRYGANVTAYGTDREHRANLQTRNAAWILYRDENNEWRDQAVAKSTLVRATIEPPIRFESGIVFEGFELANDRLKPGEPLVLIAYWHATQPIEKNYTVFMQLVNEKNEIVAGYDGQPHQGNAPTAGWHVNVLVADGIVIPIETPAPGIYDLALGWYDATTGQRLRLLDASGDHITIQPIEIIE